MEKVDQNFTMKLRCLSKVIFLVCFFQAQYVWANEKVLLSDYYSEIDKLISIPENRINILEAKLLIDKLIDPAADIDFVRVQIDEMQADIEALLPDNPSELDRVLTLRRYLYDSGPWNNENPFVYDLDDPLGTSKTSRLLHNYLRTRKGNCVSMPILHVILGQRLGLNMTLASAPRHVFVKFTNEHGKTLNIEATSGGHPARDEWYRQNMPMTDEAIANGMYLKALSSKEALAVMGYDLVVKLSLDGPYMAAIKTSDLFLTQHPNFGAMWISRGIAYQQYIDEEFYEKYPDADSLPRELMPKFQYLMHQSISSFEKAEALGWRHEDDFDENGKPKPLQPLLPKRTTQDHSPQNMEEAISEIERINRINGVRKHMPPTKSGPPTLILPSLPTPAMTPGHIPKSSTK